MGRFNPGDVIALANPRDPVPSILVLDEIDGFYVLAHANEAQMERFIRPVLTIDAGFDRIVSRDVRNAYHEGEQ
jgi:hypothetical protein